MSFHFTVHGYILKITFQVYFFFMMSAAKNRSYNVHINAVNCILCLFLCIFGCAWTAAREHPTTLSPQQRITPLTVAHTQWEDNTQSGPEGQVFPGIVTQGVLYFTSISPLFHPYFSSISPLFLLYFTSISPLFHLYFTSISPLFHLYFTSISPLFLIYSSISVNARSPLCKLLVPFLSSLRDEISSILQWYAVIHYN